MHIENREKIIHGTGNMDLPNMVENSMFSYSFPISLFSGPVQ